MNIKSRNKMKVALSILLLAVQVGVYAGNPAGPEETRMPRTNTVSQHDKLTVKGRVTDSKGEPLPSVNITIKGTQQGTVTDVDGYYTFEAPANSTLVFSYISMLAQEIPVGGKTAIDVTMKDDVVGLEEVTAIGYITMKKKDLTGAVSSIKKEQIMRIPANTITTSLVSVPGIRVNGDEIRIRGNRSIKADNGPLIILDGMPYYGTIGSIDPNDVESIDVLKDASSTSLYGSQGANGVIIVTSKKGKAGETTINYDAFAGWGVMNKRNYDPMNAQEYIDFKREAYRAAGTWHDTNDDSKIFLGNELANMGKLDEDWVGDYLGKTHFWTSHTLTLASGTEKTQYKVSLNYKKDNGRMPGGGNNKIFLNSDVNHRINNYLKVGLSNRLYYSNVKSKPDPLGSLLTMSPLTPTYDEDGTLNKTPTGDPFVKNPYLSANDEYYKDKTEEWKIYLKAYAQLDIMDGLMLRTNFAYNPSFSARGYYFDEHSNTYNDSRNVAGVQNDRQMDLAWSTILNYKKTFGIHAVDAFAVYEIQDGTYTGTSAEGKDQELASYLWYNMGTLKDSKTLNSSFTRKQMISYVGRMQYTLMDKYMATVTMREDGASQLSSGHKWDFFPSFALAWRLSEENFMKAYPFISNLKLRGSYGVTGNHSISPYATLGTVYSKYLTLNDANGEVHYTGLEPEVRPTPDLKWEKTKMVNVGLDFAFLNGRISGSADYYSSTTDDLLNQRKTPYTYGFDRTWDNIGKTKNKGWEVILSSVPIDTKDFKLDATATFYRNKEELTELYDPKLTKDVQNGWWLGYPVNGVFYDLKGLGIWQQDEADAAAKYGQKPGEVKVLDLDKNGKIDGDDRVILGTDRPDWTGSLQLSATWKDFDLSVDCYGEFGAMAFDSYSTTTWVNQLGRYNTVKLDYWTPEHPVNTHPRPAAGQDIKYINSTGYHDNSFITIRNVTLGYTLPEDLIKHVLKKTRLYVTANDPYKYMQYVHQGGIALDESYYMVGVNIQF